MASTLQLVNDSGTVLFDFNTSSTTTNPFSITTQFGVGGGMNLVTGEPELSIVSGASAPGGYVVRRRDPLSMTMWRQRFSATTYDNLAAGIGALANLLAQGGILKWIPHGSSQTRYIRFEPASTPVLLDGRELGLWQAAQLFDTPEGVQIALLCYPYLLGSELTPSLNLTSNPTLLHDFGGTANRPDGWVWDVTTGLSAETISSTDEAYQFTKADGAAANLQQTTAVASFASGNVATFSFYARVTAVAGTPQMRATVQFKQSDGTTNVGSLNSGTLTTLTTAWQRLTVTTSAAGALTSRAQLSIQVDNVDATSVVMEIRNAQAEVASAATSFRAAPEAIAADPASTSIPRRMMVWNDGDAPAKAEVRITADAQGLMLTHAYREALTPVSYLKATLHKQAESGTLGSGTSSTADANASGGNTAQTVFTPQSPSYGADSTASGTPGTNGAITVTAPASVAAGDLIVGLVYQAVSLPNPISFLPNGWRYEGFASNDGVAASESIMHVIWKVAGSNEPSSYTFNSNDTSGRYRVWLQRVSNVDQNDPIQAVTFSNSTTAGTTATITGLTTSVDNTGIVVGVAARHSANTVNPFGTVSGTTPTFTEQDDGNTGVVTSGMAADTGVLATAGATGSPTATINTSSDWVAVMVALNPGPPALAARVTQTWTSIPAGSYDLWIRTYTTAACKVRFRAKWALQSSPTVLNSMPDYIMDTTGAAAFEYALVNLGRLTVPEEWAINTLTVEVHAGLEETATSNLRIDWLDLIPANESRSSLESVVLLTTGELLVGDGELPKVFHLDTGSQLKPFGKATNIPLLLEPGYNLLSLLFAQDVATGWTEHKAKLTASPSVSIFPTPAYRT